MLWFSLIKIMAIVARVRFPKIVMCAADVSILLAVHPAVSGFSILPGFLLPDLLTSSMSQPVFFSSQPISSKLLTQYRIFIHARLRVSPLIAQILDYWSSFRLAIIFGHIIIHPIVTTYDSENSTARHTPIVHILYHNNTDRQPLTMANFESSNSSTTRNDPNEIRQKALDLLNRMGGPEADDDESNWPQPISPTIRVSLNSYQQEQNSEATPLTMEKERYHYQEDDDGEDWGVMGLWVQCISDVCKKTPTFARFGYEAITAVVADGIQERTKSSEPKGSFATVPLPKSYHQQGQYSGES
jgi:hypothetical protein